MVKVSKPKQNAKAPKKVAKGVSKKNGTRKTGKLPVTYENVCQAAKRLKGVSNVTPVITSRTLDKMIGA